MKPNLQIFIDYVKKYPNKKVCMRLLYKDYNVKKKDRGIWRDAFDLVKEKLDARMATQEIKGKNEEVEVKGKA